MRHSVQWFATSAVLVIMTLVLGACGSEEVEVHYDLAMPIAVDVFSQGNYSTYIGDDEKMGTVAQTYYSLTYGQNTEGKLTLERRYVSDASKGYLKNSYPGELLWRVPVVKLVANGIRVESVKGYEDFDSSVVAKLNIPSPWKRQLSNPAYIKDLDRNEKHRWEMGHILAGPVPSRGNVTSLLKGRGMLEFAMIQIDSVVTEGFRNLDDRRCLVYSVYLHEREAFPYFIWEQHVASVPEAAKYKTYPPGPATYDTQYWMAIDPATGVPCQEREVKRGLHTMKHPESGDTASFVSQVSLERLFTVKKP